MEHKEYEAQAERFLDEFNLTLRVAFKGDKCPPWDDHRHIHGDRYRITIKRKAGKSISLDFWNSLSDVRQGNRPTAYDVLSCISAESQSPTNPDEVAKEFGGMKPSEAIAVAKFATRLQRFFSNHELEQLAEIQ